MEDHILSPDGTMAYVDGEWVPKEAILSIKDSVVTGDININTTKSDESKIQNFFDLAIDSIKRGKMAGAKKAFEDAQQINVKLANSLFEVERKLDIAKAYTELSVKICQEIHLLKVEDLYDPTFHIVGDKELKQLLQQMDLAVNNALHYLESVDALLLVVNLLGTEEFASEMSSRMIDKAEVETIAQLGYICLMAGKVSNFKAGNVNYSTQLIFRKWKSELSTLDYVLDTLSTEFVSIGANLITKSSLVAYAMDSGTGLDFANLDEKRVETFWHDQFGGYVTTIEKYEEKIKEKNRRWRNLAQKRREQNSNILQENQRTLENNARQKEEQDLIWKVTMTGVVVLLVLIFLPSLIAGLV